MTLRFFEGAAGTGKTHNLVEEARSLFGQDVLGEHGRVLALTFMNGARRRLSGRLSQCSELRRRYQCQTFDAFARRLVGRRQSILERKSELRLRASALNEFDGPCSLAAGLLEYDMVNSWVAASYPLIIVDEAQDLDSHRLGILQPLSSSTQVVAAADEFQCLEDGRNTESLTRWLENTGDTTRLTQPMRTNQKGLLAASNAIRNNEDVRSVLIRSTRSKNTNWSGEGIRLVESPASNAGIVGWNIANQMRNRRGHTAILTPNARHSLLLDAVKKVNSRRWNGGFGPFSVKWEDRDEEIADALIEKVSFPDRATYRECLDVLAPHAHNASVAAVINRVRRQRRVFGQLVFEREFVVQLIEDAVRNQTRHVGRSDRTNVAMTIHRAKNREFSNVVVLWSHSVAGSPEHKRRLLYNAVTRAKQHCSIVVVGKGLCNKPPFIPDKV